MSHADPTPCIVVVRPGALGDTLLTQPAIAHLRRQHRGSRVVLIGNPRAGQLLVESGDVDLVINSDNALALFAESAAFDASLLAQTGPIERAVVFLSQPAIAVAALTRLGAAQVDAGSPHPNAQTHIVDHLNGIVGGAPGESPTLGVRAALGDPATLALCLGAGNPRRTWPIERFLQVAAAWRGAAVAVAGPAEPESTRRAAQDAGLALAFDLPLSELRDLLASCACAVAGDTGTAHLAAASGTPVVSLFGPSDPHVWAPRGQGVVTIRSSDGTMAGIAAATVADAAKKAARRA